MHKRVDDSLDQLARLDQVSVRFRLPVEPGVALKEHVLRGGRRSYFECVALNELDLTVSRGEVVGVIGGNGAGKTTLLKLMARILRPTSGRVRLRGKVASLIDLIGAFHYELNGRENALMNASVAGLSRSEAKARLPEIEAFAGLGTYFHSPMRTWSSGMILRLAFAVSTSVEADLLLIDEALGVGDAAFQVKCAERMDAFRVAGTAFVVVSHDVHRLAAMADRILWLERGRARMIGDPAEVVKQYIEEALR
jgi:ABC-type polysaccharide/polyol phosphate transport system ATPase subunit